MQEKETKKIKRGFWGWVKVVIDFIAKFYYMPLYLLSFPAVLIIEVFMGGILKIALRIATALFMPYIKARKVYWQAVAKELKRKDTV